jgi:branched-chain amino acid transport system permease protein
MTVTMSPPGTGATSGGAATRRLAGRRLAVAGFAAWIVVMLVLPWVVSSELWLGVGIFSLIAAIGALGLQVITGFAGQISLGHAAFMAIGAYTSAWLGADRGLPFWVWIPATVVVSGVAGALFAPAAVRIRGLYLAVATLALVFIVVYLSEVWTSLTGGATGRPAAPIVIGGQDLLDGIWSGDSEVLSLSQAWWYFAFAILLVVMVLTRNIKRSRLGRALMAVRDRDLAAGVAGIPVTRTKVTAFAISSALAGLCGALLASYMGYVAPSQWTLMLSVDFIAMVVIGGTGTVVGAVLGAFFIRGMPQVVDGLTQWIPFVSQDPKVDGGLTAPLLSQFLYGLVIVLVLLFEPRGLHAMFRRLFGALGARRERKHS